MKTLVVAAVLLIAPAVQDTVYEAGPGITMPAVVREVKPQYTARAMQERVAGVVVMTTVVRPDGMPSDIQVTEALHEELDREAVRALGEWRFKPGSRDGKAVPVRVTIQMTFTLK
jgi:TonB family protein